MCALPARVNRLAGQRRIKISQFKHTITGVIGVVCLFCETYGELRGEASLQCTRSALPADGSAMTDAKHSNILVCVSELGDARLHDGVTGTRAAGVVCYSRIALVTLTKLSQSPATRG